VPASPRARPPRSGPRPYEQRRRAEQAARTRADIVESAHRLLDDREATRLTLDEVARAAGVSRATVYNQFGSRSALLATVFEDLGRVIGYERVQAASRLADPEAALEGTVREACRCWAFRPVAIRRVLALGTLDPEVSQLNARYEAYRRMEMAQLAQRLDKAGLVRGVSPEDAAAILAALTGPHAFEMVGGDSAPDRAADRLVHMARASLGLPLPPQPEVP
jgi:AcrR family transcriptional regulator